MPAGFQFPEDSEVWTLMALRDTEESRGTRYLSCVGRLRQGVTAEQAGAELRSIARQLEERYPLTNGGWSAMVQPLREDLVGEEIRLFMTILLGAVGFVLLYCLLEFVDSCHGEFALWRDGDRSRDLHRRNTRALRRRALGKLHSRAPRDES